MELAPYHNQTRAERIGYWEGCALNVVQPLRFSMAAGTFHYEMHIRERSIREVGVMEEAKQDPWQDGARYSSTNEYFASPTRHSEVLDTINEFWPDECDAGDADSISQTAGQPQMSMSMVPADFAPTVEDKSADTSNEIVAYWNGDEGTAQGDEKIVISPVHHSKTPSPAAQQAVGTLATADPHHDDGADVIMDEASSEDHRVCEQQAPLEGQHSIQGNFQDKHQSEQDGRSRHSHIYDPQAQPTSVIQKIGNVRAAGSYNHDEADVAMSEAPSEADHSGQGAPTRAPHGEGDTEAQDNQSFDRHVQEASAIQQVEPLRAADYTDEDETGTAMSEGIQKEHYEAPTKAHHHEDDEGARDNQMVDPVVQEPSVSQLIVAPYNAKTKNAELRALCAERDLPKSGTKAKMLQLLEDYDKSKSKLTAPIAAVDEGEIGKDVPSQQLPGSNDPPPSAERPEQRADEAPVPVAAGKTPSTMSPQSNHSYQAHLDVLEHPAAASMVSRGDSAMGTRIQLPTEPQGHTTPPVGSIPHEPRTNSPIESFNIRTYDPPQLSGNTAFSQANNLIMSYNSRVYGPSRVGENTANMLQGSHVHVSPGSIPNNPYAPAMQQTQNLYRAYNGIEDTHTEGVLHDSPAPNLQLPPSQYRASHGCTARQQDMFGPGLPRVSQFPQNSILANTAVPPSQGLPNHNVYPYLPHASPFASRSLVPQVPISTFLASTLPLSRQQDTESMQMEQLVSRSRQPTVNQDTPGIAAMSTGKGAQHNSIELSGYGLNSTPLFAADSYGYRPAHVVGHAVHGRQGIVEQGGYARNGVPQPIQTQMPRKSYIAGRESHAYANAPTTPPQDRTAVMAEDETPDPLSLNVPWINTFSQAYSRPSERAARMTTDPNVGDRRDRPRNGREMEVSEASEPLEASQQIIPKKRSAPAYSQRRSAAAKKARTDATVTNTTEAHGNGESDTEDPDGEKNKRIRSKGKAKATKSDPRANTASAADSMGPPKHARGKPKKTKPAPSQRPAPASTKRSAKGKAFAAAVVAAIPNESAEDDTSSDEEGSESDSPTSTTQPSGRAPAKTPSAFAPSSRKSSTPPVLASRRSSVASVEIPATGTQRRGSAASIRSNKSAVSGKSGKGGAGANVQTRRAFEQAEREERERKMGNGSAALAAKARHRASRDLGGGAA